MEVKELRIGNLVNHKFGELEYSEVKGLGEDYVDIKEVTWEFPDVEDFEPIPLTEDWLLKFGFKRWGKDCFYLGVVKIHHRQRGFVLAKRYGVIKHVHELQNLYFALTGKELQFTKL